jgi:hypothetical protein
MEIIEFKKKKENRKRKQKLNKENLKMKYISPNLLKILNYFVFY